MLLGLVLEKKAQPLPVSDDDRCSCHVLPTKKDAPARRSSARTKGCPNAGSSVTKLQRSLAQSLEINNP